MNHPQNKLVRYQVPHTLPVSPGYVVTRDQTHPNT